MISTYRGWRWPAVGWREAYHIFQIMDLLSWPALAVREMAFYNFGRVEFQLSTIIDQAWTYLDPTSLIPLQLSKTLVTRPHIFWQIRCSYFPPLIGYICNISHSSREGLVAWCVMSYSACILVRSRFIPQRTQMHKVCLELHTYQGGDQSSNLAHKKELSGLCFHTNVNKQKDFVAKIWHDRQKKYNRASGQIFNYLL